MPFIEIKKLQSSSRDHLQRIFNDHEKLKFQLESQKKDLELRRTELEKRDADNDIERKKLAEEIEQVWHFAFHDALIQIINAKYNRFRAKKMEKKIC